MDMKLEDPVGISLPKGTLLVLFEYLARSSDTWRNSDQQSDSDAYRLLTPDASERNAIWHLEGAIERTLPEIFSADYEKMVADWKQHLISRFGSK